MACIRIILRMTTAEGQCHSGPDRNTGSSNGPVKTRVKYNHKDIMCDTAPTKNDCSLMQLRDAFMKQKGIDQ